MLANDPLNGALLSGLLQPNGQPTDPGVQMGNNMMMGALQPSTGGIGGALAKVLQGGLGAYLHNGGMFGSGGASPITVTPGMFSPGTGLNGMSVGPV